MLRASGTEQIFPYETNSKKIEQAKDRKSTISNNFLVIFCYIVFDMKNKQMFKILNEQCRNWAMI